MRNLILDLLKFSQLNRIAAPFESISLTEVANEAAEMLEHAIENKNVQINIDPLPFVFGNKGLLLQLFQNIISNSIKFSRSGIIPEIRIHTRQKGASHEIIVEDNGIGFEEHHIPNLFGLFQRLHGHHEYEGNGIGLTICKKISELHQGAIKAEKTNLPARGSLLPSYREQCK